MNIKKYSVYLWALVALSFMAFIGLMSYWYPVTFDEYFLWDLPFDFMRLKTAYLKMIPRIGIIFGQRLRHGAADAHAGAGDDGDFSLQIIAHESYLQFLI